MQTRTKTHKRREAVRKPPVGINAEKELLRRRLRDLYMGATGLRWDGETEPTPELFLRFVTATREAFWNHLAASNPRSNLHIWHFGNLEEFSNPDRATEYLYDCGVR